MLRWKRGFLPKAMIAGVAVLLFGVTTAALADGVGDDSSNRNSPYLRMGVGARALGMGGAFVGVADDATAAYWNPAGLTWNTGWEVTGMYTAGMNVDRMHNYVGVAHNAEKFAFGLQWTNAGMADIMQTSDTGQDLGEFDFGDNAIALSLAKQFDMVSLGVTGKYLRQSIGADVVSGDDAVNGFGLDVGMGMMINEWARLGLVVQNIAGKLGSVDEVNTIPATLRAGVALMPMQGLTTAFDIAKTRDEDDYRFHAGAEMAVPVTDEIGTALRVGLNHDKFSGGMGISFNFISFDYAYVVEPEKFLDENHRLSLSLKFGDDKAVYSSGDRDGDGIPDRYDECPDLAEDFDGFMDTDGCPDLDNDGDGIPDVMDDCPNQPEDFDGFQDSDGCPDPDNDGDGILDVDDKCPDQPETFNGFEDTDGCPDEVPITLPTLAYINFKFGTSEISGADPIPVLEEVARIMKERPSLKVKITGHTDSVGSDEANLALSMRRAQAVKTYLVTKGIEDTRLITEGMGESNPIDTNDTDIGRARNRRIEFSVIE